MRARPPQHLIHQLDLMTSSPTDLTLHVRFPNTAKRETMARPPRRSNNDSKLLFAIGTLLLKGLCIPAPRLPKLYSQHNSLESLVPALINHFAARASGNPSLLHEDDRTPMTPSQEAFIANLMSAARSGPLDLADALLDVRGCMTDKDCHSEWHEYLNPGTDVMGSPKAPDGGQCHVLHLAFNSIMVTHAVTAHLQKHVVMFCKTAAGPSRDVLARYQHWQRQWVNAHQEKGTMTTEVVVSKYGIRYETTRLLGWTRGPDHQPPSPQHSAYDQLYGNTEELMAFLAAEAPHCRACPVAYQRDGSGIIQFVHEAKYRNELFRLNGRTAPARGITRPLRLQYQQLRRPVAQCCSLCGEGGHSAHSCAVVRAEQKGDGDDDAEAAPRGACRDCYSTSHQQTCNTPASEQTCKLCLSTGHTSFRCSKYRTTWVPLTPPETTRAPNPRPLAIIAQQCGKPTPSWATVASRQNPPAWGLGAWATGPVCDPLPEEEFPSLSPPSVAPSTHSAHSSAPPSPGSPPVNNHHGSAEYAELRALLVEQQRATAAAAAEQQKDAAEQRKAITELTTALGAMSTMVMTFMKEMMSSTGRKMSRKSSASGTHTDAPQSTHPSPTHSPSAPTPSAPGGATDERMHQQHLQQQQEHEQQSQQQHHHQQQQHLQQQQQQRVQQLEQQQQHQQCHAQPAGSSSTQYNVSFGHSVTGTGNTVHTAAPPATGFSSSPPPSIASTASSPPMMQ
jgi:hypothetical protein